MDYNILALIIFVIIILIGLGFIIYVSVTSQNQPKSSNNNPSELITTSSKYSKHLITPNFTRLSPKSSCSTPLSTTSCPFTSINHPVKKLNRCNLLQDIVSPNHWIGNTMFQKDNTFSLFPYLASITDDSFTFGWPTEGITTNPVPTGECDLSYNITKCLNMTILGENCVSCDILDIDALITTVRWNYKIGSVVMPLAKGSPYITMEINNASISLKCDFEYNLIKYSEGRNYVISITETSGYIIYLSSIESIETKNGYIIIPSMTGVIRIAYFESDDMIQPLTNFYPYYPVESTISTTSILNGSQWDIESSYTWTTKNMAGTSIGPSLMLALPHHNITNIIYEPFTFNHPLMGTTRFIITDKSIWNLSYTLNDYTFEYPSITNHGEDLLNIWKNEILSVMNIIPEETVSWIKWLGTLANMILIGNMLKQDITTSINLLQQQLSLIQQNNGNISKYNVLVYDKTWGGTIGKLGLTNTLDDGNALYQCHIGQYGYLVYAYAVAGYFNQQFINDNKDTVLYFVRNIGNPCDSDPQFPLWRNKDWYLGYSLASGLQSLPEKNATNVGETTFGYYSMFLLSKVLNHTDLTNWSISMLASEIISAQCYYQTNTDPFISVTDRGDTYYKYTSKDNSKYPERNASDIISIVKPLSLLSPNYINSIWGQKTQLYLQKAITPNITSEPLNYALSLLAINTSDSEKIITMIKNNSKNGLPGGSTWSGLLYWVLQ